MEKYEKKIINAFDSIKEPEDFSNDVDKLLFMEEFRGVYLSFLHGKMPQKDSILKMEKTGI